MASQLSIIECHLNSLCILNVGEIFFLNELRVSNFDIFKIFKIVILYFLLLCLIDMITPREIFESYFNVVDSLKTFLDETREVFLRI